MKRKLTIAVISIFGLIVIATFAFVLLIIYEFFFGPKFGSQSERFLECKDAYTEVAQFYYEDYQKYKGTDDCLTYSTPYYENYCTIVCFGEEHNREIDISGNINESFRIIDNSYHLDDKYLSFVCVYDNFVSFGNDCGRGSYVYSINDDKPQHINSPNQDDEEIYVKKLADNWYFICERY